MTDNLPVIAGTALSKECWGLLTTGDSAGASIRRIANSPALRAEAERALADLTRAAENATGEQIGIILTRNAPVYGIGNRSPEEYRAIFGAYMDILCDLPALAIEDAFLRWGRAELYPKDPGRHAFFPKPAEIHKLAQTRAHELRKAAYRAKMAMQWDEPRTRAMTPDQRRAEREKLVAAGILTPDGKVNMGPRKPIVADPEGIEL